MLDGIKYYYERVWLVYIIGECFYIFIHIVYLVTYFILPLTTSHSSASPTHSTPTHQNENFFFILVYFYFIIIISIHTFSVSLNIFHRIYHFLFYFKTCTYICISCRTLHSTSISFSLYSLSWVYIFNIFPYSV